MSPRIYALVLSAVAATVFFGIAAANVIIDPQGVFGTNLIHSINVNQRYLRFAAYQRRQDRFDGVLFGSSRAQQMPFEALSARMNGVRFADFAVAGGLIDDHLPVLEYMLRPTKTRPRLRAVFLMIDIDSFGNPTVANLYQNTWLAPALTGENVIRFWWKHLVAIQFDTWRNAVRHTLRVPRVAPVPPPDQPRPVPPVPSRADAAGPSQADAAVPSQADAAAKPLEWITSRADFNRQLMLLERLVAICRASDVRLVVVITPLHFTVEPLYDPADMSRAVDEISRVVPLWDFTGTSAVTNHSNLWIDTSHFSAEVSLLMLKRIFSEPVPPGWQQFGRQRGQRAEGHASGSRHMLVVGQPN